MAQYSIYHVNVPWLLEKKCIFCFCLQGLLTISIRYWLIVFDFLYLCWFLRGLSIAKSGVLKKCGCLHFSVKCISFWFMCFKALYLVTHF